MRIFNVRVSGGMALWTHPAYTAERISYDVPTPCGLEGCLQSVLWRQGLRYQITQIGVLSPIRRFNLRRNEIDFPTGTKAVDASMHAVQRMSTVLLNVDYSVRFHIALKAEDGFNDHALVRKWEDMFERYMNQGKSYQQPWLGCREFVADVRWASPDDPKPIDETRALGRMIYGYIWANNRRQTILEYEPALDHGVIQVPLRAEVLRTNQAAAA